MQSESFYVGKGDTADFIDIMHHFPKHTQATVGLMFMNGAGMVFNQLPPAFIEALSKKYHVTLWNYRGVSNVHYIPQLSHVWRDIRLIRRKSELRRVEKVVLMGYSLGGVFTQTVIANDKMRSLFDGFVLMATTSSFVYDAYTTRFTGEKPPPPSLQLLQTVFGKRHVPKGQQREFIDGKPEAWSIVVLPRKPDPHNDWSESTIRFAERKMLWLFPPSMRKRIFFNATPYHLLQTPAGPSNYSSRYLNLAQDLFMTADFKVGEGPLAVSLAEAATRPLVEGEKVKPVLVIAGTQDGIFPLPIQIDLFKRVYALPQCATRGLFYADPTETDLPSMRVQGITHVHLEAASHALFFQDNILRHLICTLSRFCAEVGAQ